VQVGKSDRGGEEDRGRGCLVRMTHFLLKERMDYGNEYQVRRVVIWRWDDYMTNAGDYDSVCINLQSCSANHPYRLQWQPSGSSPMSDAFSREYKGIDRSLVERY
jgi:hypothetical protein